MNIRDGVSEEEKKARSVLDFTFKRLDEILACSPARAKREKRDYDRDPREKTWPESGSPPWREGD